MIVWSGWGICVILFAVIGVLLGVFVGETLMSMAGLTYGPAQTIGLAVGGVTASVSTSLFSDWRERSGEIRMFVDESTGRAFEVRESAGSLFFIPTRYWPWVLLAVFAFFAYSMYSAPEPLDMPRT